jgi:ribosomal protein L12E/L44/L45/RPP1/RPP2
LPTVQETLHAQGAATAVSPLRGANIARLLRSGAGSLAASAPSGAASKQAASKQAASIPLHSTPSSAAEKQQEIEQRIRNSLAAALQNLQTPASPARLTSAAAAPGGSPAGKAAGEKRWRSPSPETETDQLLQLLPPGGLSASGVAAAGDAAAAAAMAAGPQPWDMADAGALMNIASELFGACQVRRKSRHRPLTTQQASAGDRRVISGLRCPTALLDVLHCVFAAA